MTRLRIHWRKIRQSPPVWERAASEWHQTLAFALADGMPIWRVETQHTKMAGTGVVYCQTNKLDSVKRTAARQRDRSVHSVAAMIAALRERSTTSQERARQVEAERDSAQVQLW